MKYSCLKCFKSFDRKDNFSRHEKTCSTKKKSKNKRNACQKIPSIQKTKIPKCQFKIPKKEGCLHCEHIFKTYSKYTTYHVFVPISFFLLRVVLDTINSYTSFCFPCLSDYNQA